jgi:subtilisin family serine protease
MLLPIQIAPRRKRASFHKIWRVGMIGSVALLSACGGGSNQVATNTCASASCNATPSFSEVVESTGAQITTYDAVAKPVDYGAHAHLTDVGSVAGATGQGVGIMVIDDFNASHASTTTFPSIMRTISSTLGSERFSASYNVVYQMDTPFTHGDLVSRIAGGSNADAAQTVTVALQEPTTNPSNLLSCSLSYKAAQLSCPSSFHTSAPTATLNATLTTQAIRGVASEALMFRSPIDLSATQDALATVANLQGHLRNSASSSLVQVINLSLGSYIPTSGKSAADVIAAVNKFPLANTINAVISVAAGNSGQPCSDTDLNGCNAMAVSMISQAQTKDSTLVVGALTGSGSSQKIADYSTRAGYLADRYILASGDTGFYGNAQGTSFAAPRVAGVAAIIKQKYPKLSSNQISEIILLSADKDINNDGVQDFVGVDPIYGHGKLSLTSALSMAASY